METRVLNTIPLVLQVSSAPFSFAINVIILPTGMASYGCRLARAMAVG